MADPPKTGDTVADRYILQHIAGSGGMSTVWCAHDALRNQPVALKLALGDVKNHTERLLREARVLAAVDHPSMIRYLDHGVSDKGIHYLAIEWLRGQDLSTRLRQGPLKIDECLVLTEVIADALAALHAKGIVHRDLKPSNLFLVDGKVENVKIIDFGIASWFREAQGLITSEVIGTPCYMSPEQARGTLGIDARSDLYSLGCVLFECLTGRPPFVAGDSIALLTKVLFDHVIPPSHFQSRVPEAVDAFVKELLAKNLADRPANATLVAQDLRKLRAHDTKRASAVRLPASTIIQNERRLVSVVLATGGQLGPLPATSEDPHEEQTVSLPVRSPSLPKLRELVAPYGAQLEVLRDGSIAAVVSGFSSPMEAARRAARVAILIQNVMPDTQVAVVTGWEVFDGVKTVGQVIDSAATLLQSRQSQKIGQVCLDRMTAALLGNGFVLTGDADTPAILGEHEPWFPVRTVHGKPISCVGRKREIRMLEDLFEECASGPASLPILITADPGIGKSRLCEEFVRRLVTLPLPIQIWIARADLMRQKAPFALLAQLIRNFSYLFVGEPIDIAQQKLAARVACHVAPQHQQRITEFLGEIVGIPFPDDRSVQLHAARRQTMLMGDQMRRAWVDFLQAECKAQPVLLVLDDLQWGDPSTVEYIDTSLRLLPDMPLLVLALARPEVTQVFPELWRDRGIIHVSLSPLSHRASNQFLQQALDEPSADVQSRILQQSSGNAFFLEELVRAVADGHPNTPSENAVAMMQSRLAMLDPQLRRILRAGSVFGRVFWRSSIAATLGRLATIHLDARLVELERREWIIRLHDSKFQGETEYTFRHGLIQEAAYGMLTAEDRTRGHKLAGAWLERAGETDALTLATHFRLAAAPEAASRWYGVAARQALEGNDLSTAVEHVDCAIAHGASGRVSGDLDLIRAEANRWQGHYTEGEKWARKAAAALPQGDQRWYMAIREWLACLVDIKSHDELLSVCDSMSALWQKTQPATGPQVIAMVWLAIRLFPIRQLRDRAIALHQKVASVEPQFSSDIQVHANILVEHAFYQAHVVDDQVAFHEMMQSALNQFEQIGDIRNACYVRLNLGHVYNELGAYRDNVQLFNRLIGDLQSLGLWNVEAAAKQGLGRALIALTRFDEASQALVDATAAASSHDGHRLEGHSRLYLAMVLVRLKRFEQAEIQANKAVQLLASVPTLYPFALAVLSSVLLARGHLSKALGLAQEANALNHSGIVEEGDAFIGLAVAECWQALGRQSAAREAIARAKNRLLARARKISDEQHWRNSFLENVPENARILALASAWLDSKTGPLHANAT